MSMIDFFDAGAASHPTAVCLQDPSGQTWSYAEVRAATCRIARGLARLGIGPGFHGAVLGGNTAVAFLAVLAIGRAEGVWLPVNARNPAAANAEFLRDMDCDVLFYQERYREQVQEIRRAVPRIRQFICLESDARGDLTLDAVMHGQAASWFRPAWNPEATALIMSTGGTTGRSKGVMLSHRNIASCFASHMSVLNVTHGMTMLAAAPITHTAGLIALPFLARGGRLVLMDGIEPQHLLRTLQDEKVNVLFLPPTVIYLLLAQPNVREFDYSALRSLLYGAAPMSPDKLIEALDVFGQVLVQMYGQAEVPAGISALSTHEHFVDGAVAPRRRLLSAGRPFPFVRVGILDENDHVCTEPGASGEIVAQGDIVMKGYYKNPEATAQASVDGWHRTGDVGFIDEEGFLTIVDRKKDMIISGGFNVYSTEVEAALMAHPAVKDCAVIGIPDEKWGEAVKGIVELRPGQQVEADALREFARTALGGVKAPKTIDIVAQLPRSTVGKVLKKDLRAHYWSGRERAI